MYGVNGQYIKSSPKGERMLNQLDLYDLNNGLYIVRFYSGNESHVSRVFINKQ
ncbi:MAG: T9SS type A sorting domain-containing protein [Bacteroidales bacterium]|nr:T9SS type A sorting domain-containing protein [Bacteroidales bacterium]